MNAELFYGLGTRACGEHHGAVGHAAENDDRVLPPSGIPFGNVFGGPHNLYQYQMDGRNGLNSLFYPELGANFPFYDRSGTDAFNVSAEFTITTQARNLAAYMYLLGQAGAPSKPWKSAAWESSI